MLSDDKSGLCTLLTDGSDLLSYTVKTNHFHEFQYKSNQRQTFYDVLVEIFDFVLVLILFNFNFVPVEIFDFVLVEEKGSEFVRKVPGEEAS